MYSIDRSYVKDGFLYPKAEFKAIILFEIYRVKPFVFEDFLLSVSNDKFQACVLLAKIRELYYVLVHSIDSHVNATILFSQQKVKLA